MNPTDLQFPEISPDLQEVLQQIANDVVEQFGCMGSMVTTLEAGNTLVVRAYALNKMMGALDEIPQFKKIDNIEPGAIFNLNDPVYQDNLAVKAVQGKGARQISLTSEHLHDLFSPYLDREDSDSLQQAVGVKQVIAIPLQLYGEAVGSLVAAVSEWFTSRDIGFFNAYGQQAATAIQNQRRLDTMQALERIILRLQACMTNETEVLQVIVDAVVNDLEYAGAMVATLEEEDNALPVRAYAVDESMSLIRQFEAQAGVSLLGTQAVVYLDDPQYQENLSVRAVNGLNGRPENYLISKHLYDLLRPIVSEEIAGQVQAALGIKRVIAVPFFLDDKIVGNLFVTSRKSRVSAWELSILTALGQQAAVGINNARQFREAAEQRQIAQTFGRMAFSTIASAHSLRNYVGNVNGYMQLLQMLPELNSERQQYILRELPNAAHQIEKIIAILDNLNEPWLTRGDGPVDIHDCLARALLEVYPRTSILRDQAQVMTETNVTLHLDFADFLPPVATVKDMLSEAFRIIIKNAEEAIASSDIATKMWITTRQLSNQEAEIIIRDNGPGVPPENLKNIFELGWSTKKRDGGMGFGLFWTKDYIDGLGGHISAVSTVGIGTTFTIILPLSVESPTQ